MDVDRSIAEAKRFVAEEYMELVKDEVSRLAHVVASSNRKVVLLSDASFAPARIAHELRLPSLLCTNFTWDSIYLSLLQHSPTCPPPAWIQTMTQAYSQFSRWLCEAGALPWPTEVCLAYPTPIPRAPKTTHIPIFGQAATTTDSPEALRQRFGIPNNCKLALITFGGHETQSLLGSVRLAYPGWVFAGAVQHPDIVGLDPATIAVPEWMRAADVVLGKVGYGTCTEVLLANRPFVYLRRANWAEEKPLLDMMKQHGARVKEMDRSLFKSGNWACVLDAITQEAAGDMPLEERVLCGRDGGGEVAFWEAVAMSI